jgi:hypothetical protein
MQKKITIKQYIERDFGGNLAMFARAMNITYKTAYNLREGATAPRSLKVRKLLARNGAEFGKLEHKNKKTT